MRGVHGAILGCAGGWVLLSCCLPLALAGALALGLGTGWLRPPGPAGVVYALTNQDGPDNAVAIFQRGTDGKLTPVGTVPTEGRGIGDQPDGEGLGSQGALLLSPDHRWLFAANGGSGDISVFQVQDTSLRLVGRVPANGPRPLSLTLHGNILYALNYNRQAPGNGNITGFTLSPDGRLTPLPNSTRPLSDNGNVDPGQVLFSPKGDLLVVTEKATNRLVLYPVGGDGVAGPPSTAAAGGEAPFAVAFVNDSLLLTADNFGDAEGKGAASSYRLAGPTRAQVLTKALPDKQTGACWITVTGDGKYAYVANTGANAISGYQIDSQGNLRLLAADGLTARGGGKPRDLVLSTDSRFLYVLNSLGGTVGAYAVQPDGSLTALGVIGSLPAPGPAGLAGY